MIVAFFGKYIDLNFEYNEIILEGTFFDYFSIKHSYTIELNFF